MTDSISAAAPSQAPGTPARGAALVFEQALAAHLAGDLGVAEDRYRQALAIDPDHPSALNNLATIRARTGDVTGARALLERAVQLEPRYGEALNNLGVLCHQQGDNATAYACLQRATAIDPANAEWLNHLGNICVELARYDEAEQAYGRATALRPDRPQFWSNRGIALRGLRRPADALATFERALALDPRHVAALSNMGVVLKEERRFDEAIAAFERALTLDPDNATLAANFASVFEPMGDYARVRELARRALAIDSDCAEAYNLLANADMEDGKYDDALALNRQALARDPGNRNANWNLALLMLLHGDFERGWKQFEWRKRLQSVLIDARHYDGPEWDGSPLEGRTILLHTEQGIGDAIQFIRYASVLKRVGASRVVVECPPAIVSLLRGVVGVDDVVARGATLPAYDVHANLMSLPGLLGTTLDSIPGGIPYVPVEPRPVASLITAPPGTLTVGLVWAGNPAHQRDFLRSISLEQLRPLLDIPDVRFFSLQKGERASAELEALADDRIIDLAPHLGDFRDTAAAIAQLHLVLTVDTSVAHLAGAMGHPTWILLTHVPDFRWMLDRSDSPWYPSVRLFRQPKPRDWDSVIGEVAEALRGLAAARVAKPATPPTHAAAVVTIDAATILPDGRPRFDLWLPLARLADPEWFAGYEEELVRSGYARPLRDFWDEATSVVDVVLELEPRHGFMTFSLATAPRAPRAVVTIEPDAANAERLVAIAEGRALAPRLHVVADAAQARRALEGLRSSGDRPLRLGIHAPTAAEAHAVARAFSDSTLATVEIVTAVAAPAPVPDATGLTAFVVTHRAGQVELDAAVPDEGIDNAVWLTPAAIAALSTEPPVATPAATAALEAPAANAALETPAAGAAVAEIGIDWELRADTGWGIYGTQLALNLLERPDLEPVVFEAQHETLPPVTRWQLRDALQHGAARRASLMAGPAGFSGLLLRALGNGLQGARWSAQLPAARRAGIVFFEDTCLDRHARERARAFDAIVAGSSWNAELLGASGIDAVCVHQGIDPTVFHPGPRSGRLANRFVVFSGGKLEYRKGQDLVIAAFRRFRQRHDDALLVTAWHNAWPQLIADLELAGHVRDLPVTTAGTLDLSRWLAANGIAPDDHIEVGAVPNAMMGDIVRDAHVALFPNRCEGGTNLVAMECMAAGLPVIVSANTGHLDLVATSACWPLRRQRPVAPPTRFFRACEGWGESDVDEIVDALEHIYSDSAAACDLGARAAAAMAEWSWNRQIARLVDVLHPLLPTAR